MSVYRVKHSKSQFRGPKRWACVPKKELLQHVALTPFIIKSFCPSANTEVGDMRKRCYFPLASGYKVDKSVCPKFTGLYWTLSLRKMPLKHARLMVRRPQ